MHDIGYNSFLFFLDTLLNYSQSRLGAINDRMFPNTVFEAPICSEFCCLMGTLVISKVLGGFSSHLNLVPRRS